LSITSSSTANSLAAQGMLRFPVITFVFIAPIIFGKVSGSTVQSSGILTGASPYSPSSLISKTSDQLVSIQSHNQPYTPSQIRWNSTTRQPSGTLEGHNSAGSSTSSSSPFIPNLEGTCMLWNTSCHGNKTHAMNEFFTNTSHFLYTDPCFQGDPTECDKGTSPERLLRYGQVKDWMRSPQCYSDYAEWSPVGPGAAVQNAVVIAKDGGFGEMQYRCCQGCIIHGGNIDIYYWPEVNASTSCLNIVGNDTYPLDYGATTDATGTYWGCTGQDSTLTKTASVTTVSGHPMKAYINNPWSSNPCTSSPSLYPTQPTSTRINVPHPGVFARAHSLITTSSNQNIDSPIVSAVVGNFTL